MTDAAEATLQVETIAYAAAGIALLLGASSMLMPAARRLAIPHTVLIAIFGAGVGALLTLAPHWGGAAGEVALLFSQTELPSEALLYLFLPPLLFAAGLHMDFRHLMDDVWPVTVLAIVAVVLGCVAVGAALIPFIIPAGVAFGSPAWMHLAMLCLLIGAVAAPTDTAAVVSIFKEVGAPRRLSTIVEGESLFNDAAAIALVVVLISAMEGGEDAGFGSAGLELVKALGGGLILGFILGRVFAWIAQMARGFVVAETTLTVTLAYLAFASGQLIFHVSGVIAVVAAALAFGAKARTRLTPGSWDALLALWKQLDFWAITLIFIFAAMAMPAVLAVVRWSDLAALGVLFLADLVARAVITFIVMPALAWFRLSAPISMAYRGVLAWGGIRGAVTIVLALFVAESPAVNQTGPENARLVLVLAIGYVLLTLFVNATTLRLVMRLSHVAPLDRRERVVRDRVMALSRARVEKRVADFASDFGLQREPHTEPVSSETALSHPERVQVGLLALVSRETELVMEALERGLIERDIAEIMLQHTARMSDLTRSDRAKGYTQAWNRNQRLSRRFRLALWLHRRLGFTRPLANEIALRFEVMLSKVRLLGSLESFATGDLPHVIGKEASAEVQAIIHARREALSAAMAGMERQYPGYATMVRELLVERLALALEQSEYRVQREQGLISEAIYEDLEADRQKRVRALTSRPPLDLGLEITTMVGKVPLFAGMSDEGLTEVAKLLRPELAVEGERIIRTGTIGREMYFIVSGTVEVIVPGEPVRLKGGDFFGEVALLTSRPRNADVIAVSYCEMLVLLKRDLDKLLDQQPRLRDQMQAHIETRAGIAAAAS